MDGTFLVRSLNRKLLPVGLLLLLLVGSSVIRLIWANNRPNNTVVFDEAYYVNAARSILGIPIPVDAPYEQTVPGMDPNTEHPPLGKLFIATGMELAGDRPIGWRMASVLFGTVAIAAMYCLVSTVGGSGWLALGAATLMTVDNMFLIHGGIATLDIFVLAFMLVGCVAYLRKHALAAGVIFGVGACVKTVGLLGLVIVGALELLRVSADYRRSIIEGSYRKRLRDWSICGATAVGSAVMLLYVLDLTVTSFSNPFSHLHYMYAYHTREIDYATIAGAPASAVWEWLINRKSIVYSYDVVSTLTGDHSAVHSYVVHGRISPFIVWMALPALIGAGWLAHRQREDVMLLPLAWLLGTLVPLAVLDIRHLSFIYYMLVVLPGVYLAIALLFSGRFFHRTYSYLYGAAVLYSSSVIYRLS